jgi:hypothetical protein
VVVLFRSSFFSAEDACAFSLVVQYDAQAATKFIVQLFSFDKTSLICLICSFFKFFSVNKEEREREERQVLWPLGESLPDYNPCPSSLIEAGFATLRCACV